MSRRPRWGDTLDEEDLLPPPVVKGPDDNGVKTITEYVKNDKGETIKRTSKIKVVTVEKKVYKVTEQRRNWTRFGRAATETPQDSVTIQQVEEIPFERIRQLKATSQEKKATDIQQVLATQTDKTIISGSIKEMLYKKRMERELLRAKGLMAGPEKPPEEDGPGGKSSSLGAPKAGSYVPPSLRNKGAGGEGESMMRKREDNSLRVTNLSEDVSEGDLAELFRPFGHVLRIFLAVDKTTGENRGFAFVNYAHKDDADRAIRALNGYGYDNLILRVEWAAPRKEN